MFKIGHKAQAAVELAIFGAILVFILGAIIRSAVGNSYTQNQNFKAMRMAMLASWQGSESSKGLGAAANTSHNSASLLFIEDRLSPDFNKYGDLDRNAYVAQGSGSFTYEMLYPLDVGEPARNLPIMDVYINGQHFPFTTASYVTNQIHRPGDTNDPASIACGSDGPYEYPKDYPITSAQCEQNQCLRNQREWVGSGSSQYKLFYTMEPNGTSNFFTSPPGCNNTNSTACKDKALSSTLTVNDKDGNLYTNANGDMQYDLLRNGDYTGSASSVETVLPVGSSIRNNIAWQWAATAGTNSAMIGLDPNNNQYPTYDIDGRLKEVTIYAISQDKATGDPIVTYEDNQGGDIDSSWDANSCGPKPGLQNYSQILTFTGNGTYLQVREGKMYNPETGQEVRSVNRRNNIDIVQRAIQLSNNTGRFCTNSNPSAICPAGSTVNNVPCANPNPVEICADSSDTNCAATNTCTCFGANTAKICYDTVSNIMWVRSRLEDRRGNFWMTNASGQLQVQ